MELDKPHGSVASSTGSAVEEQQELTLGTSSDTSTPLAGLDIHLQLLFKFHLCFFITDEQLSYMKRF